MLARLWWKEWRAFGPTWLALALSAAGLQWLLLSIRSEDVRAGALTPAALVWAVFYAFAAGSAAFAGERESGTMGFLDALPVGRPTLWLGKAAFALASTFGLALLMAGLAAVGTSARDPGGDYGYGPIVRMFGTLLFEAVAWGLFWSTVSRNPLLAGAMSVVSVAIISIYSKALIPSRNLATSTNLVDPEAVPARLLLASGMLIASAILIRRAQPWSVPAIPRRGGSADRDRPGPIRVRRASAARSLDWQTWREGWTTGVLVAILGLVLPIVVTVRNPSRVDLLALVLAVVASLIAGVAVFGAEGGSATPRFLVQHGVAPGVVWARRVRIWGLAMGVFLAIFLACFGGIGRELTAGGRRGPGQPGEGILVLAAILLDALTVGIVCGMAIPRRLTAVLVGLMGVLAVVPLTVALVNMELVPSWTLLLTPAILLGVSRAWAGDWMAGREGAGAWARLGLLLLVPAGLSGSCFVAWRAWGEPDVGPQFRAAGVPALTPGRDAVEVYRRAIAGLWPSPAYFQNVHVPSEEPDQVVIERGWDSLHLDVVELWSRNRPAMEPARRASALPVAAFEDVGRIPIDRPRGQTVQGVRALARLLALDTRERMSRGDLPGAWEDILAQLRVAEQLATATPTLTQMVLACQANHQAVGLAIDWAGLRGQTAESVRSAGEDLKRLPPLPSMEGALRVESLILDRTFDQSADELAAYLASGSPGDRPTGDLVFSALIAPPWERIRARRLCRRRIAGLLPEAAREPWQRSAGTEFDVVPEGSRLARLVFPAFRGAVDALDREVVGRRALGQVLAVKSWQLAHGGEAPETLEALVPGELDRLPVDPYSGRPFGYVRSERQPAPPPILFDNPTRLTHESRPDLSPTRPGQPIVYSLGANRADDTRGGRIEVRLKGVGDILFPVP